MTDMFMNDWRNMNQEVLHNCAKSVSICPVCLLVQILYHQRYLTTALFAEKEYMVAKDMLKMILENIFMKIVLKIQHSF